MPPSILLSIAIAICYGCVFHVVVGRRMWQWPLFCASSLVGFFAGYVVGVATGLEALRIGSVPVAAATLGALLALLLAWYFSVPWARAPRGQPTAPPGDRSP